jgi:hypothetical protein
VELAILDDSIPMYHSTDESGRMIESVPDCAVNVTLKREPFLHGVSILLEAARRTASTRVFVSQRLSGVRSRGCVGSGDHRFLRW